MKEKNMQRDKTGMMQEKRDKGGRFVKGVSGNPAGRKQGSRSRATVIGQELIDGKVEVIVKKAMAMALDGDTQMLRTCLERLIPVRKSSPIQQITLPVMKSLDDLPKLTQAILTAASSGELTPDEAEGLMKIVAGHVKAVEIGELETRLKKLEEKQK